MSKKAPSWANRLLCLRNRFMSPEIETQDAEHETRTRAARRISKTIIDTHRQLLLLPDLTPGELINSMLGDLVASCCEVHTTCTVTEVLSNADIRSILPSLRQKCAEAEYQLEAHWAEYIGNAKDRFEAESRLKQFPYHQNYTDLTRLEISALLSVADSLPRRIAFIGSGPLPLSSMFMLDLVNRWQHLRSGSKRHDEFSTNTATILNIDHSRAAITSSSLMVSKLRNGRETDSGIDVNDQDLDTTSCGDLKFLCQEAAVSDLADFDTVFLAALVGQTKREKEQLILRVVSKMTSGSMFVVRTSWGLRTCLYPEVDLATEALAPRLKICSVVHPYNDVVNSVIVAQVR
ncbi:Nicotianamine synthase [Microdochium trichocladiopsis]|uniref:Nicotianamine synthase n=1 Tax=Microdochium trichocladiopsis TaxID=1682393 RepID=A0A9P9BKC3_9PEZI|nr:Nicotianamine synthase [Microdochium trichocladiopsis]KAH7018361.1 Nicotianamine synthase [Microdochium trichocladiopsis]